MVLKFTTQLKQIILNFNKGGTCLSKPPFLRTILLVILIGFLPHLTQLIAQDSLSLHVGGALRFNYNLSSWKSDQVARGGDFGYDLFRLNLKASYAKLNFNAEYRLYSSGFGGGMLKQGWVEYSPSKEHTFQLGLTQVPFGIQQYNSHNWFFNIGYYVGLEDDHDMGIKYILNREKYELQIAYFKNAEELNFGNNSAHSYSRYSYDVTGRNKEVHQGNLKFKYKFGEKNPTELGFSLMYGGLYNIVNSKTGHHYGVALFYETNIDNWNIKLQAATFSRNPADSIQYLNVIEMGAYGAPYNVSAKGDVITTGISYAIPIKTGLIDKITLYNDFGIFIKKYGHNNSVMNVLGAMVQSGFLYTYIDIAAGRNHPWLGPLWTDAFAQGVQNSKFHVRFNINFGIYL